MSRLALGVIIFGVLTGCVSVSQVAPPGTSSATVTVSTNLKEQKNIKVRYQGVNSCATYPGKLIGMINSATIGIEGGNPIRVLVPAGEIQVISVMGMAYMRDIGVTDILLEVQRKQVGMEYGAALRELYFAFIPVEGHKYFFQFDSDGQDVKLVGYEQTGDELKTTLKSLPLPNNCINNPIRQL